MNKEHKIKELVKKKYSAIASQTKEQNESSGCGTGCCNKVDYSIFSENYNTLEGYNADADLGLGCGLPTEIANIQPGNTVIDLGSGAGNDCFVVRAIVGEAGKVIGIDFTPAMIEKASAYAEKLGFKNVEFRQGDIDHIPVSDEEADVIISNCVLNLVPNKYKVFSEIYRVLKPGGHFSISDVVLKGELPENLRNAGEMYAGCVGGAAQREEYLQLISDTGFESVLVPEEKEIELPDDILLSYLSPEELIGFKKSNTGIFSITVYAEKPNLSCRCGSCSF